MSGKLQPPDNRVGAVHQCVLVHIPHMPRIVLETFCCHPDVRIMPNAANFHTKCPTLPLFNSLCLQSNIFTLTAVINAYVPAGGSVVSSAEQIQNNESLITLTCCITYSINWLKRHAVNPLVLFLCNTSIVRWRSNLSNISWLINIVPQVKSSSLGENKENCKDNQLTGTN